MQYDRVVYLLEPNDLTKGLRRKKVCVHDYPNGTIAIKCGGVDLPYSVFDKVRQVKQADIVSNKPPTRRGQRRIAAERFREVNPAAL